MRVTIIVIECIECKRQSVVEEMDQCDQFAYVEALRLLSCS